MFYPVCIPVFHVNINTGITEQYAQWQLQIDLNKQKQWGSFCGWRIICGLRIIYGLGSFAVLYSISPGTNHRWEGPKSHIQKVGLNYVCLKNIDRKKTTLHANFTAAVPSHFINLATRSQSDMELIPLELQPTLSMSRRKARDAYLIDRGKTLSPEGMNFGLFPFLFLL